MNYVPIYLWRRDPPDDLIPRFDAIFKSHVNLEFPEREFLANYCPS